MISLQKIGGLPDHPLLKRKYAARSSFQYGSLHFHYILSKFPVMRAFDKWILSYEVGFKKPAIEIFQKAIAWASVKPSKILFIDDMKTHVDVATSLGMQGIHFISADQFKDALYKKWVRPC